VSKFAKSNTTPSWVVQRLHLPLSSSQDLLPSLWYTHWLSLEKIVVLPVDEIAYIAYAPLIKPGIGGRWANVCYSVYFGSLAKPLHHPCTGMSSFPMDAHAIGLNVPLQCSRCSPARPIHLTKVECKKLRLACFLRLPISD
jgi:hypothetical protein